MIDENSGVVFFIRIHGRREKEKVDMEKKVYPYENSIDEIIRRALLEDVGTGDVTTLSTVEPDRIAHGKYIAKENGVLCGMDIVRRVFRSTDMDIRLTVYKDDGDSVEKGDVLAEVEGNAARVLTCERVGLNLLQHLSGIATQTARAAEAVAGTGARIADTRKTTPGLRVLEKYAVKIGGGSNHRFNLADGVLIKDNHIVAAGSIDRAVNAARKQIPHTLKIEVEVETLEQLEEALAVKADIIMLDNMSLEMMREAVRRTDGRALLEASGNMGDKDLRAVADTGVDLISIGALTHSVRALDISLKFQVV